MTSSELIRIDYLDPSIKLKGDLCFMNEKPFTGVLLNNKTDKHTITEQIFVKGKREGGFTEWFKDKTLKTKKIYQGNVEHGAQQGFHYNGKTSYTYEAVKGKIHGLYVEYYPTGTIQIEETYDMDSIVSSKKINIDGFVEVNYHIKNNRKYGLVTSANCANIYKKSSVSNITDR